MIRILNNGREKIIQKILENEISRRKKYAFFYVASPSSSVSTLDLCVVCTRARAVPETLAIFMYGQLQCNASDAV